MVTRCRQHLPEGLAMMPVGPVLAAALDGVDPARVAPADLPVLLHARWRQRNHDDARWLSTVHHCALADPDAPGGRRETLDEFAADEIRATLVCSTGAAWRDVRLADDLIRRHPTVYAAMDDGDLDLDRARAFRDWTMILSDPHAHAVVAHLQPEAPTITVRTLIERIQELATALDPEWATRLYDNAKAQRRLRARRTESGTANLSGLDLPLDDVVDTVVRIESLAAAAKAAGHRGLIDTIRADVYLALLSPHLAGSDDDSIVAAVLARAGSEDPRDRSAPNPDDAPPDTDPPSTDPPSTDPPSVDPPDTGPGGADGNVPPRPGRARRGPRRARIELRVALSTLLELDDKPARLPGWGVIHADLARHLATVHTGAEWRAAVTGPDGELVAALITRRRPSTHGRGPDPHSAAPRAVVEIHVDAQVLADIDPAAHPAWAGVLADLQAQLRLWERAHAEDEAAAGAEAQATAAGDRSPAEQAAAERVAERQRARARQALARFPGTALARWIETRDRHCCFPPCRHHAVGSDLDHTRDVVLGGLTIDVNLGPLCGHEHRLKHLGGWELHQPRPGHFVWTSRTGRQYVSAPRSAVPDVPDPDPDRARPGYRSSAAPAEYAAADVPTWTNEPYPAHTTPPPQRAPPPPDDDPPPF